MQQASDTDTDTDSDSPDKLLLDIQPALKTLQTAELLLKAANYNLRQASQWAMDDQWQIPLREYLAANPLTIAATVNPALDLEAPVLCSGSTSPFQAYEVLLCSFSSAADSLPASYIVRRQLPARLQGPAAQVEAYGCKWQDADVDQFSVELHTSPGFRQAYPAEPEAAAAAAELHQAACPHHADCEVYSFRSQNGAFAVWTDAMHFIQEQPGDGSALKAGSSWVDGDLAMAWLEQPVQDLKFQPPSPNQPDPNAALRKAIGCPAPPAWLLDRQKFQGLVSDMSPSRQQEIVSIAGPIIAHVLRCIHPTDPGGLLKLLHQKDDLATPSGCAEWCREQGLEGPLSSSSDEEDCFSEDWFGLPAGQDMIRKYQAAVQQDQQGQQMLLLSIAASHLPMQTVCKLMGCSELQVRNARMWAAKAGQ